MQGAPESADRYLDDHAASLRAAGASEADVAAWVERYRAGRRRRRPRPVAVEPVNWPAVQVWTRVHSQWRMAGGMGLHYLGLDAAAVWATLRGMGHACDVDVYDGVMVIGDRVAQRMNERMREATERERDAGR